MRRAYDVVIAGGGVNGCACAYFLAASPDFGGTVAVIERDPTYRDAPSARATGGIRQQFSTPENVQIGLFGADFVKHIGEHLAVNGVAPDVGFREAGYLLLATPETLPAMRENNALQRRLGASVVLHEADALASRFPWLTLEGIAGGSLGEAGEGWLDPYSLLQAFRAKARALGVELVTAEVASILRRGSRVSGVRLTDGTTVGAGSVVDAAGASGAARLAASAGIRLPIESRKRCTFVFTTRTPITGVPLTILPEGLAFRPEGTTFLANLAPPPEQDPECFDHEIDYAAFEEQIWPLLAARVPAFEAIKLAHAWSCHYDFNTFDENAIVGPAGEIENLYLLVGFSGHGLQQSPAMGRATAELIVHGAFRTLDLRRMGYARIAAGEALRESNCY
jgi:FAD-dependent oxidoreductase domain-containing protein 1